MSVKKLIKVSNYLENKYNLKNAGWFSKDPEEKLIKELEIKEFIELCQTAGLENVKQAAGYFDMTPKYQVSFTCGPKNNSFWLGVFNDASGGNFGRIPLGQTWSLPAFRENATGGDLIVYLGAVKRTINSVDK